MKVLIIHTGYQLKGGEDSVVEQEMELLRSNGIMVEKLSFSNDGKALIKFLQLPFNISSYNKTKQYLQRYKPDVVHIHNLHFAASVSVVYAVKRCKVPCVFTLHNYRLICPTATLFYKGENFSDSLKKSFSWNAVFKGVYKNSRLLTFWLCLSIWLNRKLGVWKMIDRFIVLTPHAKELIDQSRLKLEAGKIVVKPNFTANYFLPVVTRQDNFLYVGRLSPEKGIATLLAAFEGAPYSLTIIGDGPLKEDVLAYTKNNRNVTYRGFQSRKVIIEEMRKCNALVFPSLWYETFGLTIIEAFALSTAVIASKIGAPARIVKDNYNGLHFAVSNAKDLRARLDEWQAYTADKKEVYRQQAFNTYLQYYTPEENYTQLLSIYTAAIQERSRNKVDIKQLKAATKLAG